MNDGAEFDEALIRWVEQRGHRFKTWYTNLQASLLLLLAYWEPTTGPPPRQY